MKYQITFVLLFCVIGFSVAQSSPSYASSTFSFPVSDIDEATEWYKQLLGEVEYFSPAEGVVEFKLNEQTWLQLFTGAQSSGATLRLEVTDIQSQHQRLTKLGIEPMDIELVPAVISYFDFKDPDGNLLSFYKLE